MYIPTPQEVGPAPKCRPKFGHYRRPSLELLLVHFWRKVCKDGDCWEWKAGCDKHGYGRIGGGTNLERLMGGERYAHRISWILTNGLIPVGLLVLHKCDNPKCLNPKHLFLGDLTSNYWDMRQKGRASMPPNRWEKRGK